MTSCACWNPKKIDTLLLRRRIYLKVDKISRGLNFAVFAVFVKKAVKLNPPEINRDLVDHEIKFPRNFIHLSYRKFSKLTRG